MTKIGETSSQSDQFMKIELIRGYHTTVCTLHTHVSICERELMKIELWAIKVFELFFFLNAKTGRVEFRSDLVAGSQ